MNTWEDLERVVARNVLDDATRVSAALTRLGVPHALVGGLAVGLRGHPRATRDVDFIVLDFLREHEPVRVASFSRIAQRALQGLG